jgi:hypothetical protein
MGIPTNRSASYYISLARMQTELIRGLVQSDPDRALELLRIGRQALKMAEAAMLAEEEAAREAFPQLKWLHEQSK